MHKRPIKSHANLVRSHIGALRELNGLWRLQKGKHNLGESYSMTVCYFKVRINSVIFSSWVRLSSYDCVVHIPAQTPPWFAYTRKENPQSGFQDFYKVFPNFLSNYWTYFPLAFNIPARMLSISWILLSHWLFYGLYLSLLPTPLLWSRWK